MELEGLKPLEMQEALTHDKLLGLEKRHQVINTEIIAAKAMFLAYSDPFEKYRALLFEQLGLRIRG